MNIFSPIRVIKYVGRVYVFVELFTLKLFYSVNIIFTLKFAYNGHNMDNGFSVLCYKRIDWILCLLKSNKAHTNFPRKP